MWLNQTCINFCSVPIACFVVVSFRGAIFFGGGGVGEGASLLPKKVKITCNNISPGPIKV